jgi:hypothetical protein
MLNLAPLHEDVGEWRYSSTHSLTSALDGGEWSASRPGCFTPSERAPCTHWIGGCVGPRIGMDALSKRKIPSSHQESNPDHPIATNNDDDKTATLRFVLCILCRSRDSSVGIATSLRAGRSGFDSRQGLGIFLFATASRPAVGSTQPPMQWVPGALSPEVNRQGREADHSSQSSAEVKNAWSSTSTTPIRLHGVALN